MVHLNLHRVKYLLGRLSIILTITYVIAYIWDLSGAVTVLAKNDEITHMDLSLGNINEVKSWEKMDVGYKVRVAGTYETEMDIPYGELIYHCDKIDEDWYVMELPDDSLFWTTDGVEGDVVLTTEGFTINDESVDSLPTVEVLVRNDKGCRLRVSTGYDRELLNLDIFFCRSLPTDKIYFNKVTQSLICNVNEDFVNDYIGSSQIWFFIFVITSIMFLNAVIGVYKEIPSSFKVDALSMVLLTFFVMLTYLVLG